MEHAPSTLCFVFLYFIYIYLFLYTPISQSQYNGTWSWVQVPLKQVEKGGEEQKGVGGGGGVRGQEAAKGVDAHLASCLRIAKILQLRVPAISSLVTAALLSAALTRDSATDNHNSKPTHPSPVSSPYLSSHTVSTNKHPSNCHLPTYLFW